MTYDYWRKQTAGQPLFPDLLWSRPERRAQAGKLGIVGGNVHGFAAAATAYAQAEAAGVGTARVLLPDSLRKTVGRVFVAGEYAPSTPSGSFSQRALGELLALATWGDGLLVAGDLAHNSETAILLEQCIEKYSGQLTLTKDAVDYLIATPQRVLERPDTLLVVSFAQLQKLARSVRFPSAFTFDMDLLRLVEGLHEFTQVYSAHIIVKQLEHIVVASSGQLSSTALAEDLPTWRLKTAAQAAVWWLQNPSKSLEALTTALISDTAKT